MIVHTIAQDSRAFTGRKCPMCSHVVRPGQTIVQDRNSRWVAHRNCLQAFIVKSYTLQPVDGEVLRRRTREEREALALRRAIEDKQRANDEFVAYRDELVRLYANGNLTPEAFE